MYFQCCPLGVPMGLTQPIFKFDVTIYFTYLYTEFGVNRIEIATCRVIIHIHTPIHTENLSSREIGRELQFPYLWDFLLRSYSQKLVQVWFFFTYFVIEAKCKCSIYTFIENASKELLSFLTQKTFYEQLFLAKDIF